MIVELAISLLDRINFVLGILTFLTLLAYTYFTYRIAEGDRKPRVSFNLFQIIGEGNGHIGFSMLNKSKVDVEVWAKIWTKIGNSFFSDTGFYGDKSPWALESFMQGKGHFIIGNLVNSNGDRIDDIIKKREIRDNIKLYIQIRYKKIGKMKTWKKSLVQRYVYDFKNDRFWLDV